MADVTTVNRMSTDSGAIPSIQIFLGSLMNCKQSFVRNILTCAVTVCTLGLSAHAHAFSPLATDDTGTQGQGGNQVELYYIHSRDTNLDIELDDRVDINASSNSIPLTYTYGLTDNVDLSIGIARQTSPVSGWLNSEIGIKWNFYGDQSSGWSAAIKPIVLLPVSKNMQSQGLGSADTNWGVNLISSYMAEDYEFHANLRYTSNNQASVPDWEYERKSLWTLSVAPVWNINPQWKLGVDLGIETNPGYDSQYTAFGQLAVSYAPIENLQIGAGIMYSAGLNSDVSARGLTFSTGLTYQF